MLHPIELRACRLVVCYLALSVVLGASRSLVASGAPAAPAKPASSVEEVRRAMLETYIHGVEDGLASRVLAPSALPILRRLLLEPDFARRDNVVAFLAHLDSGEAVPDLLAFLTSPPRGAEVPEEDRALLLAPQALGRIARRGDAEALEALLKMTSPGAAEGPLGRAASHGRDPDRLLADLVEMALRGLAFSCAPQAWTRLHEIGGGLTVPGGVRDLARAASRNLILFDQVCGAAGLEPSSGGTTRQETSGSRLDSVSPGARPGGSRPGNQSEEGAEERASVDAAVPEAEALGTLDTYASVHDAGLTYANHAAVTLPMTDSRLDEVLRLASLKAGRVDFLGDVACCATVSRSGGAGSFGRPDDGLDIIDDSTEEEQVLNDRAARAKLVRAINYCGGPVTNVIGCAWWPGNGFAVVRIDSSSASDLPVEAVLWIHEYGHNIGLGHNADIRYLMYQGDYGGNNGLSQEECDFFHDPNRLARITPQDTGVCTDNDTDEVQDGIDNCPFAWNPDQLDTDLDRQGDACDPDDEGDGVPDSVDNCPILANADQTDSDADGQGNACDPDDDNDGILDAADNCPLAVNPVQGDWDSDSLGDECDPDDDGDGVPDDGDCADLSSSLWSPPGEVRNLVSSYDQAGAFVQLSWDPPSELGGAASTILYDTIASTDPADFSDGADCIESGDGADRVSLDGNDRRPLRTWSAQGDGNGQAFGSAVSGAGDVNGDGFGDVIVGAPLYGSLAFPSRGQALVHAGSASGLSSSPAWVLDGTQNSAQFGWAAGSAGDVNGDGYSDVIVGAHLGDNGQLDEGRAFVYLGSASGLGALPAWSAESNVTDARFGYSVDAAGDVNGDGFGDVIVGALRYNGDQAREGRAFVYLGSASGLSAAPAWIVEGNQVGALFGSAVAGAGDVNGDGHADVLVGAATYDSGETNEGRAFLFFGSASGLSSSPAWTAEGDQAEAWFGFSLAAAGDVNGDGFSDVIIGAHGHDGQLQDEGRAYLYLGSSAGLAVEPAWVGEGGQESALFGFAVASAGDVNADGFSDLLVGAHLYDDVQTNEGRVFVYLGSSSGPTRAPVWMAEVNQPDSFLGYSVASAGDVFGNGLSAILVGARSYSNVWTDSGAAFSYLGTPASLMPGNVTYYLVRAKNFCGAGPAGTDSSGAVRSVRACPSS